MAAAEINNSASHDNEEWSGLEDGSLSHTPFLLKELDEMLREMSTSEFGVSSCAIQVVHCKSMQGRLTRTERNRMAYIAVAIEFSVHKASLSLPIGNEAQGKNP